MSRYVEAVYLNSGVAPQKLHYIPWGIDPLIFRPDAPPRQLPTSKSFRFLYVGGTILRKGFDRVLNAYLAEFGPHDDVCLVVKDVGTNSFYAPQCMRSQVIAAMRDPANPTIIYLEEEMTAGQLASLYTACHCLASPYRGEGFGLPVLEGLACGLPPIVPSGGPTDDFVDPESGYLLPSTVVPAEGVANLPGPGGELQISIEDLRTTMRRVYENGDATRRAGLAGSQRVRRDFTWQVTTQHIVNRLAQSKANLPVNNRTTAICDAVLQSKFSASRKNVPVARYLEGAFPAFTDRFHWTFQLSAPIESEWRSWERLTKTVSRPINLAVIDQWQASGFVDLGAFARRTRRSPVLRWQITSIAYHRRSTPNLQ